MKTITRTALGLTAAALALTACGGSPSPAACKTAMRAEFAAAIAHGTVGSEPTACKGLPASELRRLAGQVLSGR